MRERWYPEPFGANLLHYKSLLDWPDVAKSNTATAFYCVNELSVCDRFAITRQWRNYFPQIWWTGGAHQICFMEGGVVPFQDNWARSVTVLNKKESIKPAMRQRRSPCVPECLRSCIDTSPWRRLMLLSCSRRSVKVTPPAVPVAVNKPCEGERGEGHSWGCTNGYFLSRPRQWGPGSKRCYITEARSMKETFGYIIFGPSL